MELLEYYNEICSDLQVFAFSATIRSSVAAMITDYENEIITVLGHYGLGRLAGFERNERGYVNKNFAIETEVGNMRRKYFLRRYKSGISEPDIEFEHSIIQHLDAKGFDLVASVIPTLDGRTFIRSHSSVGSDPAYYAIFEYRIGEDRYTCVDPHCSEKEIVEAAAVLAQFHQAISDLTPCGHKSEPSIFELLDSLPGILETSISLNKSQEIEEYLRVNSARVLANIERIISELDEYSCQDCPRIVIHCDYHPGNLQFMGNQVSSLFDFDWSKVDARIFDIGLALFYFFASWGANDDGQLRAGEMKLFLQSYQSAFSIPGTLGPLTAAELRCLLAMIQAGNLYVFNWALQDYCHKTVDIEEYMMWIKHSINTILWLEQHANHASMVRLIENIMKEFDD